MSILFGIRQLEGTRADEYTLHALSHATGRWAPDGMFVRVLGQVGMGFQPFHTHERSNLESHPVTDNLGNMITLDGRLDNHEEICELLDLRKPNLSDSQIVLRAFERWGEECFSKLVGDWAIALWSKKEQALYLARDHAGTRTLYFAERGGCFIWATFLETLLSEASYPLDSEYLGRYLACLPLRSLTPYRSIQAVRPAHLVRIGPDSTTSKQHWRNLVDEEIRYRTDADYEHHFRWLFRQSIKRRTGKGARILAHLSGGMDSSSIVCMSDHIRREQGGTTNDLLDTISYFDTSEPHWNEEPYVSLIEERRGKTGFHVLATTTDRTLDLLSQPYLLPGPDGSTYQREQSLLRVIGDSGYRVILSGAGGDECFGGIATGLPELADYVRAAQVGPLLKSALAWAIASRQPLGKVLFDSALFAYESYAVDDLEEPACIAPWLQSKKTGRGRSCSPFPRGSHRLYQCRPSAIRNAAMWEPFAESLPQTCRSVLLRFEFRYPCLDRDIVDFVFRIPVEQLIRPGRRRSLMRRSVAGILPTEIIERRRKAYIVRGPLTWFERHYSEIDRLFQRSRLMDMQMIDSRILRECLRAMVINRDFRFLPSINRAIALEIWIQSGNVEIQL